MPTQVTKRDGSLKPFSEEKIRAAIEEAAKDVGLEESRVAAVTEQVATAALAALPAEDPLATTKIRDAVLAELDRVEPAAAAAWRDHDRREGKT